MEKSLRSVYYRSTFRRGSYLTSWFLTIATFLTSYPRMLIEVFTRRNFGQRYFNITSVLTVTVLLFILPFNMVGVDIFGPGSYQVIALNWAWYLYTVLFFSLGIKRWLEIRRAPSTYNFSMYSLYMGDVSKYFDKFGISIRTYEIYIEPGMFLLLGYLLHSIGQSVGMLLMIAAFLYSFSYIAAYKQGDDSILDIIDEMLFAKTIEGIIMNDDSPERSNGIQLRAKLPRNPSLKNDLLRHIQGDDSAEAI